MIHLSTVLIRQEGLLSRSHRQGNDPSVWSPPSRPEFTIVGPHFGMPMASAEDSETAVSPIGLVFGVLEEPLQHFGPEGRFAGERDRPNTELLQQRTKPLPLARVREVKTTS